MKFTKNPALVILSISLLIFAAGCNNGNGGDTTGSPKTPFLGGTEGLSITFEKGMPPDEVTDGGTFPFQAIVSLKNNGEYDLKKDDVKVSLVGIQADDFGAGDAELEDQSPDFDPTPRQRDSEGNIRESAKTSVTFPSAGDEFNYEGELTGNTMFTLRAEVCYKYETKAVAPQVCMLENLIDVAEDAICNPTGTKEVFSSGSPIQVQNFQQSVSGKDRIAFSFDIVHSGNGYIFDPGTDANCPKDPSERRINEDKVGVVVDTGISGGSLSCIGLDSSSSTASGSVRLVDKKASISCTQTRGTNTKDFTTGVDITVKFNYLDKADKGILVKHLIDS
jgi:hypothetical protein